MSSESGTRQTRMHDSFGMLLGAHCTLCTLGCGTRMPKKFRVANDRPHATRSALLPVAQSRKSTETNPMNKPPSTVGHAVVSRGKGQGMNEGLQVSEELRQVHGRCSRQRVKMARDHSDERHAAVVVVAAQTEDGGRMRTVNFENKTRPSATALLRGQPRRMTRAPVPWLFPTAHCRRRHAAAALPSGRHKRSLCVRRLAASGFRCL